MGSTLALKSIGIALWPSLLVTLMLDYGSQNSTFSTVIDGVATTVTGVEGILLHIKQQGFLAYAASLAPTFVLLLVVFALFVFFNQWRKNREHAGNA